MPKRFTATEIWDEDWFTEMPIEYREYWRYMLDKCNHAGIFKPNVVTYNKLIENKISPKQVLKYFNNGKKRVRLLKNDRWFIEDFIVFQYGRQLNSNNRVHSSIILILAQNGVKLTSIRGLDGVKEGVKDKDKDIDKEKDISTKGNGTIHRPHKCENPDCPNPSTKMMGIYYVCSDDCYLQILEDKETRGKLNNAQ